MLSNSWKFFPKAKHSNDIQGGLSTAPRELVDLYTIPPKTLPQKLTSLICLPCFNKPSKPLPVLDPHYSTFEDLASGRNRHERVPTVDEVSTGSTGTYTRFPTPFFSGCRMPEQREVLPNGARTEQTGWYLQAEGVAGLSVPVQPQAIHNSNLNDQVAGHSEHPAQKSPTISSDPKKHLVTPSPSPPPPFWSQHIGASSPRKPRESQTVTGEEAERSIYLSSLSCSSIRGENRQGSTSQPNLSGFPERTHAFLSRRLSFDTRPRLQCGCHLCRLAAERVNLQRSDVSLRGGGDDDDDADGGGGGEEGTGGSRRLGDDERVSRTLWWFAGGVGRPPTGKRLREWKAKDDEWKEREKQAKRTAAAGANKSSWWKLLKRKGGKKGKEGEKTEEPEPAEEGTQEPEAGLEPVAPATATTMTTTEATETTAR